MRDGDADNKTWNQTSKAAGEFSRLSQGTGAPLGPSRLLVGWGHRCVGISLGRRSSAPAAEDKGHTAGTRLIGYLSVHCPTVAAGD